MKEKALWRLWIAALVLSLTTAATAYADHPSAGLGPGIAGPSLTIPAITSPAKTLSVDLRTELINLDTFSDAELETFGDADLDVHSTDWLLSYSLGLGYGLTDDLTLGLRLPYLYRNDLREGGHHAGHGEVEMLGDVEGIGDLTLFGQYRFYHRPETGQHVALLFGLKTPTGETDERSSHGELFEVEHQPGSGSWDPMAGLAYTNYRDGIAYHANLLYVLTTEGERDTELGDSLTYNGAISWRASGGGHSHSDDRSHLDLNWDLMLELNGEYRTEDEVAGIKNEHSGGSLIYISPGVRLSGLGPLTASLSVGIPALEDLNGEQSEPTLRTLFVLGASFP